MTPIDTTSARLIEAIYIAMRTLTNSDPSELPESILQGFATEHSALVGAILMSLTFDTKYPPS